MVATVTSEAIAIPGIAATDVDASIAASRAYDVAIWSAGYEQRSTWLVKSGFKPSNVLRWLRVEYEEDRTCFSGPDNLNVKVGDLFGNEIGKRYWDGHWLKAWRALYRSTAEQLGRRIDAFVDISSMPRTVYGTALLAALRFERQSINSITICYVPGIYGPGISGSRRLDGLRSLIGTEGISLLDRDPAFVLGLGYDGILARAVIDVFQVAHFSALVAAPGVTAEAEGQSLMANADLLARCELVAGAPAMGIAAAYASFLRLADWYGGSRDVVLVPLGPKPHVVAAILAAMSRPEIALRWVLTGRFTPVDVAVPTGAIPYFFRLTCTS
jgi:hypothetical protein